MSKKTKPIQNFIFVSERGILLVIAVATIIATLIELVRIISVQSVNLSDLFIKYIYLSKLY